MLNDDDYEKKAKQTLFAFEVEIEQHPGLFSGMMSSVVAGELGMRGVMVSGQGIAAELAVKRAHETVRPTCTILRVGHGGNDDAWLRQRNTLLRDVDGIKEMVQVCEGTACRLLDRAGIEQLFGSTE